MQPGQYSNYPRPVRHELSFSVVGEAWSVIMANLGPFVVASLLALLAVGIPTYIGTFLVVATPGMMSTTTDPMKMIQQQLVGNAMSIPFSLLGYALSGPIVAAMVHMTYKHLSGQKPEVGDVTWGFSRFVPFALATLISFVLITIGMYLVCIPGLIAGGLVMLVIPAMVVKGLSPFDALSFSFSKMSKHLVLSAVLFLVLYFLSGIGFLACCVGILVTYPWLSVGSALVYRDVVGFDQPAAPMSEPAPTPPQYRGPSPG